MNEAVKEAGKELGRIVLLSVIPVVVDSLLSDSFSVRVCVLAGSVAALRAIEKFLHEYPKTKGLPF